MDPSPSPDGALTATPRVSIVFLVFNRRNELAESLRRMTVEDDFPADRLEVIVVDNASSDGSADMVRESFPGVRVIRRAVNCGVSGWNDGFAVATGDWVLALDDDCYLPRGGLREALAAAREHEADLVSFSVASSHRPDFRFTDAYRTGLLMFWGCAVLVRRTVLDELGGYDPEIFVWANELEFTLRFFDAGHRHLYLPEVTAVHMKHVNDGPEAEGVTDRSYQLNARHWGYIAAKLLGPRDAPVALANLLATFVRDAARIHPQALRAAWPAVRGFRHGLRHRAPVAAEVSTTYRRGFHTFVGPWWSSRPPLEILRAAPARLARAALGRPVPEPTGRGGENLARHARFYPTSTAVLQLRPPT
jgi:GT2 family glycosyltransferase